MRVGFVVIALLFVGCFTKIDDLMQQSPGNWSSRESLTVVLSAMQNNYSDQGANVQVIGTPYYPSVIAAINQLQRSQLHWSDEHAKIRLDALLKTGAGLYMDWQSKRMINARGNYFRKIEDLDSLLFLISLRNKTWPSYIPDITDIDERVFLLNEQGDTLRPRYLWGRNNNQLSMEETMFARFVFRNHNEHFLRESENMYLVVAGFEHKIVLAYPLSKLF